VKVSKIIGLALGLWLACGLSAMALTFEYTDGTKVTGDIVRVDPKFLQVRTEDNKYVEIEWSKFSQATLLELQKVGQAKKDNKLLENIVPYIEIPEEEIIKKTQVPIKTDYPKLERPEKGSLLGAMFKSSVGLLCLILLYGANIYAGYEVACVRAYPPGLVCGIAAVAPIIGPVIFLCMPTKLPSHQTEEAEEPAATATGEAAPSASYAEEAAAANQAATATAGHAAAAALPETQVFKRGQFTFNRRFIETKFSAFFPAIRRGADKDLVLLVKSVRGEHIATRISRIAANDMHLEVHKGGASQEVQMPFLEIQEIHLKHKDA